MECLTNKEYWTQYWTSVNTDSTNFIIDANNPIRRWLQKANLDIPVNSECLEIGCYPGQYLTYFGEKSCILNGIDLVDGVETQTPQALRKLGFKVGEFKKVNFFEYCNSNTRLFDIVCSFGFLEHFRNWEEVLLLHTDLLKKGGYLIIETPNFRSIPHYLIRLILDKKNLKFHELKSMRPNEWKTLMMKNDFEIIYCGGIGNFSGWAAVNPKMTRTQLLIRSLLRHIISPFLDKILPTDNNTFSALYGLIVRRIQ